MNRIPALVAFSLTLFLAPFAWSQIRMPPDCPAPGSGVPIPARCMPDAVMPFMALPDVVVGR